MQTHDFLRANFRERIIMLENADGKTLKKYCTILILQQEKKKLLRQKKAISDKIYILSVDIESLNQSASENDWRKNVRQDF